MDEICVIGGAGYVGLITGVGFAALGYRVTCVDVDRGRLEMLKQGKTPIHEEGLEPLLADLLSQRSIVFTDELDEAASLAKVIFIAVGTPPLADGRTDLSQAISVAEKLAHTITRYTVFAVKSTVPVGAFDVISEVLSARLKEGRDFDVVSNPEFLSEGRGLEGFFNPDRIVVGSRSERAAAQMREIYGPLTSRSSRVAARFMHGRSGPVPYIETDVASAQLIKYAANAFLAARISLINEVAGLSERVGANITDVIAGLGLDQRIGQSYLRPGLGFGGPCLEKDLQALITLSHEHDYKPVVLESVLERNNLQLKEIQKKLVRAVGSSLYRKQFAVFGLAFKEGTNDVRNSLSLRLMRALLDQGALVRAHDPLALDQARPLFPEVSYHADPYEAVRGTDAMLILTADGSFKSLDYARVARLMASPVLIDVPNLLDPPSIRSLGFRYESTGRRAPLDGRG